MTSLFNADNYVPSLREAIKAAGMPGKKLNLGFQENDQGQVHIPNRRDIFLVEGKQGNLWRVESLRDLFRGDRVPPTMGTTPPPEYDPFFFLIEFHMVTIADAVGVRPDREYAEMYSSMRRRPDGKSLGITHDALWQTSALLLGLQPLSAMEFEAIMSRLTRSAKTFSIGPVSRNYIENIQPLMRGGY